MVLINEENTEVKIVAERFFYDTEETFDDCTVVTTDDDLVLWCDNTSLPGTAVFDDLYLPPFIVHKHCTVQVLRDSATGEESVGWHDND